MRTDRSQDALAEPRAIEHSDDLPTAAPSATCGAPTELVILERFTGWWCPSCSSAPAAPA